MSHLQRNDTLAGPPPAYRLSDQEFDAKIASAVEASLHNSVASLPTGGGPGHRAEDMRREEHGGRLRPRGPSASRPLGARALPSPPIGQLGQTSQTSPSIQPLNIHKQRRSVSSIQSGGSSAASGASASNKERPSWYAEAGLGEGSSSAQSVSSGASSSYAGPHASGRFVIHNPAEEDDDVETDAPPPFSAVGPSPNGLHFEELRWDPQQEPTSTHTAPSPAMSSVTLPPTRPASSISASSQLPPRPPSSMSSRPVQQQRLSFGAYGTPDRTARAPVTHHTPDRNALSLYSSSVAPHVISTPPRQSYSSSRQTQSQARQSWISMPMPAPVAPTPTYPAQDFTNYTPHPNPSSQRWATSEHELRWS